jgi:nucleoside-diphosphate-sugar epimerase
MKVIVTGCNGLVGSALVRQCIANPAISHVFALTRKPLPEAVTNSPKATVIEHDDFSAYPPELLARLAGAEGCLWWVAAAVSLIHKRRVLLLITVGPVIPDARTYIH